MKEKKGMLSVYATLSMFFIILILTTISYSIYLKYIKQISHENSMRNQEYSLDIAKSKTNKVTEEIEFKKIYIDDVYDFDYIFGTNIAELDIDTQPNQVFNSDMRQAVQKRLDKAKTTGFLVRTTRMGGEFRVYLGEKAREKGIKYVLEFDLNGESLKFIQNMFNNESFKNDILPYLEIPQKPE